MWFVNDCKFFFLENLKVSILSKGKFILVIKKFVFVDQIFVFVDWLSMVGNIKFLVLKNNVNNIKLMIIIKENGILFDMVKFLLIIFFIKN